jgi:hypothetical protein
MTTLTAKHITDAILKWPGRYETEAGRLILGAPVSQVAAQLRDAGWRNLGRGFDPADFGVTIVRARYVGGARPKRFCDVVVAGEVDLVADWAKAGARMLQYMHEEAAFDGGDPDANLDRFGCPL